MDDEYQAYMTQDLNAVMNLGNLLGNSGEGDPTGGYGGMPPDYTVNDPIGPDLPITNPPPAVDPNDPIGPDLPPDNPRDAVDPNDPLVGGTPPKTDTPPQIPTDLKNLLRGLIVGDDGKANPMGLFGIMALLSMMRGSGAPAAVGYQGSVPKYTAVRERVKMPEDPNRRPGSGGRRYFSDTQYVPTPSSPTDTSVQTARTAAQEQAETLKPAVTKPRDKITEERDKRNEEYLRRLGLWDDFTMGPPAEKKDVPTVKNSSFANFYSSPEYASYVSSGLNRVGTMDMYQSPYFGMLSGGSSGRALDNAYKSYLSRTGETPVFAPSRQMFGPVQAAQGGLMGLAKGRYLNGSTDGMADKIPASIDGNQPARLSHGEFVIPADVVSHLGNGNSESGAQRLYDMMDRIRKARTGTTKQGKQINPDKFMPR